MWHKIVALKLLDELDGMRCPRLGEEASDVSSTEFRKGSSFLPCAKSPATVYAGVLKVRGQGKCRTTVPAGDSLLWEGLAGVVTGTHLDEV